MDTKEKPTMVVVSVEDWEEYQELKKNRETKEFKLEVGGDYIAKNNEEEIVIDRKGRYGNVGFFGGKFVNNIECYKPFIWREATEEEVIEAFEKESARRLGEDWREAKLKTHAKGATIHVNTGRHQSKIIKNKHKGWIVWNKNGIVYFEGKWAEKLEESKFAENLGDIDRPWYLCMYGQIREVFEKEDQNNNHLPTKKLAEGQLALSQLLSFRHDVWEKEGKPENTSLRHGIFLHRNKIESNLTNVKSLFQFKKEETAKWFLETHKELLTEYFNKLIK